MQNHRYTQLLTVLVAFGITIFLILLQFDTFRSHRDWTIATGTEGGAYNAFGESLTKILNSTESLGAHEHFQDVDSNGSVENLRRLEKGEVQFGLAQSDSSFGEHARLVAPLYKEVLHILVRADSAIPGIPNLNKKRVFLGAIGSGTRVLAKKVTDHFGLDIPNSPALDPGAQNEDLLQWIVDRFQKNEIDAAFILAPPGSKELRDMINDPDVALQLIGFKSERADHNPTKGFSLVNQGVSPFVIPPALYGSQPDEPISTIYVEALLLAADSVDGTVVHEIAESLFNNRNTIANHLDRQLDLRETEDATVSFLPYHRGAKSYYARENPSFFVEYAEVISLTITLLVGLWSIGTLFVRWRAGLRKERIDVYYAELRESASLENQDRLSALRRIHEKAFSDLMSERLAANESFIIFQDYLLSEIIRTERAIDNM